MVESWSEIYANETAQTIGNKTINTEVLTQEQVIMQSLIKGVLILGIVIVFFACLYVGYYLFRKEKETMEA